MNPTDTAPSDCQTKDLASPGPDAACPAPALPPLPDSATQKWLKAQLFDSTPMGLCVLHHGRPLFINDHLAHMLGGDHGDAHATAPELQLRWPDLWPQLQRIGRETRMVHINRQDGSLLVGRAYTRSLQPLLDGAEVVTLVDDTRREGRGFSATWRARMLEQAETIGRSGSAEIDMTTGKMIISKGMHSLLGIPFSPEPMRSERFLRWVPKEERGYVAAIWQGAITDEPFEFQHRLVGKDGTRMEVLQRGMVEEDATGQQHGYLIVQDITAQRQAEQRIQQLAHQDVVTGLSNRTHLLDQIDAAVNHARWDPGTFLVLSVQVDKVDQLKQAMGYGAGDSMARAVAERLKGLAEPGDVVARIDGGEFAVMVSPQSSRLDATGHIHARAVVDALSHAERVAVSEIVPGARVGVARFPQDAETAGELLEAAQMARMRIDAQGEQVAVFTPETRALAMRRLAIESGLRHAADRGELALSYQLQADLSNGEVIGAQAVLEWTSGELGPVPLEEFMPVALQSGLVVSLGDWKRNALCAQLQAWEQARVRVPRMSTRISTLELQQHDVFEKMRRCMKQYGLTPQSLGVEITERALVEGGDSLGPTLSQLKALGVEITLGDFGANFTNLALLRSLPVDVIKVDRSCVPDVTAAVGAVSLTRAIINMGHSLQMQVMAEGVETTGQLTLLIASGCDRMQGPVLAPPVNGETLIQMLAQRTRLPDSMLSRRRERTLLLVDDEPSIVSSLKRLFRRDGYRIVTAGSGAEGLQRLTEYEVDVVLSDQRMPGMTGVEFLRRAKDLYPDTVRLVLSGYTELQSITDAVNEGAIYRFLTKPWDDERLLEHVREAFAHKEMADENKRLATEVVAASEALTQANERLELVLSNQQQQIDLEAARANTARDLLDSLPVALLGVDPHGTIVLTNQELQRALGAHTPLLGASAAHALGHDFAALAAAGAAGAAGSTPASRIELPLGGRTWHARVRALGDAHPRGVLLTLIDPLSPQVRT